MRTLTAESWCLYLRNLQTLVEITNLTIIYSLQLYLNMRIKKLLFMLKIHRQYLKSSHWCFCSSRDFHNISSFTTIKPYVGSIMKPSVQTTWVQYSFVFKWVYRPYLIEDFPPNRTTDDFKLWIPSNYEFSICASFNPYYEKSSGVSIHENWMVEWL